MNRQSQKAAYDESLAHFQQALAQADRLELKDPLLRAYLLKLQAQVCSALEHYDDARTLYQQALDLKIEALGEHDPQVLTIYNDLAYVNKISRHVEEMRENLKAAQQWNPNHPKHPEVARAFLLSGDASALSGRFAQADLKLKVADGMYETIYGPSSPERIESLVALSQNLNRQHRLAEAETLLRKAIEIADANQYDRQPPTQPFLATLLDQHTALLKALDRNDEARAPASRAKELRGLQHVPADR